LGTEKDRKLGTINTNPAPVEGGRKTLEKESNFRRENKLNKKGYTPANSETTESTEKTENVGRRKKIRKNTKGLTWRSQPTAGGGINEKKSTTPAGGNLGGGNSTEVKKRARARGAGFFLVHGHFKRKKKKGRRLGRNNPQA